MKNGPLNWEIYGKKGKTRFQGSGNLKTFILHIQKAFFVFPIVKLNFNTQKTNP